MPHHRRKLLDQRKELVERYVRLAVRRKMLWFSFCLVRFINRPRLKWMDRKRNKILAKTLKTFALESVRARRNGFQAITTVLNLGLFLLIAERDIQSVKIDALTHPDPWQRNLAARIMLLTIHELNIDKAAGASLRQALEDGHLPDDLKDSVVCALRSIRKAQSRAQRQFSYLRNATIAHRDSDAIKQYRDIVEIDSVEVTKVAAEFYEGAKQFIDVLPKLISHLSNLSVLVGQLAAQQRRKDRSP